MRKFSLNAQRRALRLTSCSIRLAGRIELQFAWLTFACLCLATFLPVFALRWLGPRISSQPWQKAPDFHNDL